MKPKKSILGKVITFCTISGVSLLSIAKFTCSQMSKADECKPGTITVSVEACSIIAEDTSGTYVPVYFEKVDPSFVISDDIDFQILVQNEKAVYSAEIDNESFVFSNVAPGTYELSVKSSLYTSSPVTVEVKPNSTVQQTVKITKYYYSQYSEYTFEMPKYSSYEYAFLDRSDNFLIMEDHHFQMSESGKIHFYLDWRLNPSVSMQSSTGVRMYIPISKEYDGCTVE